MEQRMLGQTSLQVSRLSFGTLTLSPAQAGFSAEAGGELLAYAYERGVTFWDTAELYDTYPHIRAALRRLPGLPVISTKTYAWDAASASASLDKARQALDLDIIDIFLLHEQESSLTLDGHREAFAWLLEQKSKGLIRAVGISTHAVEPVLALTAAKRPDLAALAVWQDRDPGPYRDADVIHPLLNLRGIGLLDGSADDMVAACARAYDAGLGIYGMKMLGGGHLLQDFKAAADFALNLSFADAFAVGMQSEAEVDMNIALFSGQPISSELLEATRHRRRRLAIGDWCTGCGACVARCGEHALHLENGRAVADNSHCIFCGYCATVCRDFCIKVV
jgi:predicted aldo/keto reductase-like oxidoreductase